MTIKEFMDGIQLPKDAQAAAVQIPLPKEEFVRMNRLFWQDIPAFWEETEKKQNAPQWFLRFYTTMGPECFSRFREAGISQDIFFATLKDITIWARAFYQRHGSYGISQAQWAAKGMRMEVLRLGRLQFEPSLLSEGVPVLKVHIPEDGPLKKEEVMDSFRQAKDFFSSRISSDSQARSSWTFFTCESWLLFPDLASLLPENSNILQFQKLFQITETVLSSRQAEERIFGFLSDNPADYPAKTSLQKHAREYLMKGKKLGIGEGRRPFL